MKKIFLLIISFTCILIFSQCKTKGTVDSSKLPIYNVVKRLIGDKVQNFIFDSIPLENGKDVFEIESKDGKIILRGSSQTAIGYAFNWYLNYYCHSQISKAGKQINIPNPLPVVPAKIKKTCQFQLRYYLNYCTYNYTMSFWDWNRWEKELDWMAIHGINMPLAIIGTEAVWQNTLKRFGFNDNEIKKFIPGPAYTAWWLMGNLEGWGGSVSQSWIDSRVVLQKKILSRMHELGMKPVLQGFYGMVPDKMREKFPKNNIKNGGIWAGKNGFQRPAFLVPTDTLFSSMAKVFYEEQAKLYGNVEFYGGDPFHEGGNLDGIDITKSASIIHKAMMQTHPSATWVLQGWWDNPKDALLAGIGKKQVMILDLFAESRPQWEVRKGYDGRQWAWCTLLNFGSKVGMYGKLDTYATEPVRALHHPYGKSLCGIGTMMEGCETNPVNYELIYEMAWHDKSPVVSEWIKDYVYARYGKKLPNAEQAWDLIYKTVYSCPTKQEGTSESIFCARGDVNVTGAFRSGTINIYYDTLKLLSALKLLLKCSDELKNIDTYQYDIVDLTRQVISNYGQQVYHEMITAYQQKKLKEFKKTSSLFLQLIKDQDTLLSTRKEFLLGSWIEAAKKMSTCKSEQDLMEYNARTLITVWGDKGTSEELHDYSNREWSGILKDFYLPRWKLFIDSLQSTLEGKKSIPLDYYSWENQWTMKHNLFQALPTGDPVKMAKLILEKNKL